MSGTVGALIVLFYSIAEVSQSGECLFCYYLTWHIYSTHHFLNCVSSSVCQEDWFTVRGELQSVLLSVLWSSQWKLCLFFLLRESEYWRELSVSAISLSNSSSGCNTQVKDERCFIVISTCKMCWEEKQPCVLVVFRWWKDNERVKDNR